MNDREILLKAELNRSDLYSKACANRISIHAFGNMTASDTIESVYGF